MRNKKLKVIDLFSGSGGMTLGFEKAGFENVFSVDNEPSFCATYKLNFPKHKLLIKNIKDLKKNEILKLIEGKSIDVIIGGPPCQGFSIAGNIGRKFVDDPRNHLFKEFIRVVEIVKPKFFVMENVARLYTHNNGSTRNEILSKFKKVGYYVECRILNSADYGVPQIRRRIIFIGSRITNFVSFPEKNIERHKTVKEALRGLPVLRSGQKSEMKNHMAMDHSDQMLKKMSYISNGGNRYEMPENIRPKTGDIRKYIRYNGNMPAITVTGDMRKVFHYFQNRALTVRELARLQSYPDDFVFEGTSISQQQQVGNSVPPLMAEAIANIIKCLIKNSDN